MRDRLRTGRPRATKRRLYYEDRMNIKTKKDQKKNLNSARYQ